MLPRICFALLAMAASAAAQDRVPKWSRFETSFTATAGPADPLDVELKVTFRSPSGKARTVPAFWDGGRTWRVRFSPNEPGTWQWESASVPADTGLNGRKGTLECTAPQGETIFEKHGPVRLSDDRRYFVHDDGTPFFLYGDTAWNGPLFSTPEDWTHYIGTRKKQGFNTILWVTTQWRGAPEGDASKQLPFTGKEQIRLNLDFFRRLEQKHEELIRAGMLSVPVMLWAIDNRPEWAAADPGSFLPEKQAIRLARYTLARWGADPVLWILNGDGDYRGPRAERWRTIGRGVFDDVWHAPVSLHPGGLIWVMDEFRNEGWLDIAGYQSAHGDSDRNSQYITTGPPAQEWTKLPVRPVISLEAPYEGPGRAGALERDFFVRRNHLWSLMNAPTPGIVYGSHSVWSWSDGVHPPALHGDGVLPHWKTQLDGAAAIQFGKLKQFFEGLEHWRLRPAPAILAAQPGEQAPRQFISVMQHSARPLALLYTPESRNITLKRTALQGNWRASWVKPDTLTRSEASGKAEGEAVAFTTPAAGDWLLLIEGPAPETIARAVADELLRDDFKSVVARFSPEMQKSLTEEQLRQGAGRLKPLGPPKSILAPEAGRSGEMTVVNVPVIFEPMAINIQVTVNAKGEVAGLYFRPRSQASAPWTAPAYSKAGAFRTEEVTIGAEPWQLPGTLTLPATGNKCPAVVLVHGSGPNDRDESVGGAKVFRDLAEGLSSRGIAVLRYEKRTRQHAARIAAIPDFTLNQETVEDAVAAAAFLRTRPEIDGTRVFVLGHSLGGYAAPRIGKKDPKLAGLIIMAGNTRPIEDLIAEQTAYISSLGQSKAFEKEMEQLRSLIAQIKNAKAGDTMPPVLGAPLSYWLDLREYRPAEVARSLSTPMLILQGERDYQVTMADLAGWKAALGDRGNVRIKSYPSLNHLFAEGEGKSKPAEYLKPAHVSESVIADIAEWIAQAR